MNVVLSSPGIKAFLPHSVSNSIQLSVAEMRLLIHVALNSELILQCLSLRSKCDKGSVSNMVDEDREGFSFCIRFNMAEMQRLNWCCISAR